LTRNGIRAAYKIKQRNTKVENTAPEIEFGKLFAGLVIKPPSINIAIEGSQLFYSFNPDFQFIGTNLLVEIDGPYHRTKKQESKTRWRDSELFAKGYRVLHIDSELLMRKKYHEGMIDKVMAFKKGDRQVEHLYT
jgi:hypothetical protein